MRLFPRQYTINCPSRSDVDRALITTEFGTAAKLAAYAQANLDVGTYTNAFIPTDLSPHVKDQLKDSYGNANTMNSGTGYTFTMTCDDTNKFCKNGYYASMSDSKPAGTMNLCSAFWDVAGTPAADKGNPDLVSTSDILADCKGKNSKYDKLVDVRLWRAQTLLHEWTHTTFFTGTSEKTIDYAYGPKFCLNLAAGSRKMPEGREWKDKKKTIPYCPDENNQPGYCDKNLPIDNADTLAIIAGGLWLSDKAQCDRELPIGETADPPPSKLRRKRQSDPGLTEIVIDPPWDGYGFDPSSCTDPDANGCCGDCTSLPTVTSSAGPSAVTCQVGVSTTIGSCPSTFTGTPTPTPTAKVPGQRGVPGCAYVLSEDLGPQALCSKDYCNCGGTVAPLLTVSGTLGCAYPTQPAKAQCPS